MGIFAVWDHDSIPKLRILQITEVNTFLELGSISSILGIEFTATDADGECKQFSNLNQALRWIGLRSGLLLKFEGGVGRLGEAAIEVPILQAELSAA